MVTDAVGFTAECVDVRRIRELTSSCTQNAVTKWPSKQMRSDQPGHHQDMIVRSRAAWAIGTELNLVKRLAAHYPTNVFRSWTRRSATAAR